MRRLRRRPARLGLGEDLHDALDRVPVVLDDCAGFACLGVGDTLDRLARLAALDAEVAKPDLFDLLRARRHDAFQRRIPRLGDAGRDRDQSGCGSFYDLVAIGSLAVDPDRRSVDLDFFYDRQLRQAEQLRQHRRHHPGAAVVRLGGADDEVGLLRLDRGRECACSEEDVGAGELRIGDEHAAIGAHRQAFADGVFGAFGTHRNEDHLAAVGFLELQTFFDPALVAGVENDLSIARDGVVGLEDRGGVGVGHLLDGDDDLHKTAIIPAPGERHGIARSPRLC